MLGRHCNEWVTVQECCLMPAFDSLVTGHVSFWCQWPCMLHRACCMLEETALLGIAVHHHEVALSKVPPHAPWTTAWLAQPLSHLQPPGTAEMVSREPVRLLFIRGQHSAGADRLESQHHSAQLPRHCQPGQCTGRYPGKHCTMQHMARSGIDCPGAWPTDVQGWSCTPGLMWQPPAEFHLLHACCCCYRCGTWLLTQPTALVRLVSTPTA